MAGAPRSPAVPQQAAARDAGGPVPGSGAGAARLARRVLREDGKALEVGGISEEAADTYSDRAKELRDRARELAGQYERDHGHAPGKRAMWAIKQRAALETRDAKEHNPPAAGAGARRVGAQGRAARRTAAVLASRRAASVRGRARAERAAERGGAGADHPQGRSRGPAGERHLGPVAADFRARPGRPRAARRRRPGGVPQRPRR